MEDQEEDQTYKTIGYQVLSSLLVAEQVVLDKFHKKTWALLRENQEKEDRVGFHWRPRYIHLIEEI